MRVQLFLFHSYPQTQARLPSQGQRNYDYFSVPALAGKQQKITVERHNHSTRSHPGYPDLSPWPLCSMSLHIRNKEISHSQS